MDDELDWDTRLIPIPISTMKVFMSAWISVDARMPEGDDWVLAYSLKGWGDEPFPARYDKSGKEWTNMLMYSTETRGGDSIYAVVEHVTHWMPLPKPPEEK